MTRFEYIHPFWGCVLINQEPSDATFTSNPKIYKDPVTLDLLF